MINTEIYLTGANVTMRKFVVPFILFMALSLSVFGVQAQSGHCTVTLNQNGTLNMSQDCSDEDLLTILKELDPSNQSERVERLQVLDRIYRLRGWTAWANRAGFEYDEITIQARQPEEEIRTVTENGELVEDIVVSGLQVEAKNLIAPWPACMTTDHDVSGGRSFQPDTQNPSVLYTDNDPFDGTATIWADCTNWSQLAPNVELDEVDATATQIPSLATAQPTTATPTVQPTTAAPTAQPTSDGCLSQAEIQNLGTVHQWLYDGNVLSGAQITLNTTFNTPAGWTMHHNGTAVLSAAGGQKVSLWSANNCRPLK